MKNVGITSGSTVAQLYIEFPYVGVTMPPLQLKGFSKVRDIPPGHSKVTAITLDKYAISFWDSPKRAWSARAGKYRVLVGSNSDDLVLEGGFELQHSFHWTGL